MKKEFYSNCFLTAFYLWFRLQDVKIFYTKSTRKAPFGHMLIIARNRMFHFVPSKYNQPWWKELFFKGSIETRRIDPRTLERFKLLYEGTSSF